MSRENLAFLIAGLAFGVLCGYGMIHNLQNRPDLAEPAVAPPAPAEAPMVQEINRLKARLQDRPDDREALTTLAHSYHDASMWEQAIGYYDRLLAITPDDPDLLTDQGTCYRGTGQFDKALALFERAHRADPNHWQSLFNTAVVAIFDVGNLELAMTALTTIESIEPRPPDLQDVPLARLREALEQARAASRAAEG